MDETDDILGPTVCGGCLGPATITKRQGFGYRAKCDKPKCIWEIHGGRDAMELHRAQYDQHAMFRPT